MSARKSMLVFMTLLTLVATLVSACSPTPTTAPGATTEKLKVAFVYVAPVGDMGWTWSHDQGRKYMEEKLAGKVETAYSENIPEGPEAERVIRDYATKGYKLIITTSFGFMDPTVNVAKEFPNTWFVHISGYKTAANLSTVFGKIEEPRFVSGIIAGKMTKTNKLGYVAAFPIPEVVRGINAFTLGVRSVNPNATVKVIWTNTWFDPAKEKEAAVALLNDGCDVIAQHQDTAEPQKAAEEKGLYGVGYDSDMGKLAPKAVLTSPVWNWGPKYVEIAEAVMAGTYKSESYWGGWQDGVVDLAPYGAMVPADVRALGDAAMADFKAGKQTIFTVFSGPLKDNTGAEKVPAGQSMTAEQLLSMDWLVEGVIGSVK